MTIRLPVEPVGHEEHIWRAEPDGRSGRVKLARASGPYQSCVPARIADYAPTLPAEVAADVEEAATALSHFDTYSQTTLGQAGEQAPMEAVLLRTESASSSQIEELSVGARQLALAELNQSSSENARTVAGNVHAMQEALALPATVNRESVLAIHRVLLADQPGWEQHAGLFRNRLVWVGRSGLGPRDAAHVGPQPELIEAAMDDLVSFVARVDLPIVLQIAVAHAQFETIHPFADGNGRTGRVLVHVMLRASGLVTHTIAPVSAGLLTHTSEYFSALTAYRNGDALPIVEQFADSCRYAANSGRELVDALRAQLDEDATRLAGVRSSSAVWRVLPLLVAHPVVNARLLQAELGLSEATAQRALARLVIAGVLEERSGFRRNRIWQHAGVLAILDEYAASLKRM